MLQWVAHARMAEVFFSCPVYFELGYVTCLGLWNVDRCDSLPLPNQHLKKYIVSTCFSCTPTSPHEEDTSSRIVGDTWGRATQLTNRGRSKWDKCYCKSLRSWGFVSQQKQINAQKLPGHNAQGWESISDLGTQSISFYPSITVWRGWCTLYTVIFRAHGNDCCIQAESSN